MVISIDWRRRLTAPTLGAVAWNSSHPSRLAVVSTESGTSQAWAWDLDRDERRQASGEGVGAEEAHITPDGLGVVWWLDPQGDERGRWMVTPFEGGDPCPLLPTVPDMWMSGLSLVGDSVAAGFSDDDAFLVVVRHGRTHPRALPPPTAGRGGAGLAARPGRPLGRRLAPRHLARRVLDHREPRRPGHRRPSRAPRSGRSPTPTWPSSQRAGRPCPATTGWSCSGRWGIPASVALVPAPRRALADRRRPRRQSDAGWLVSPMPTQSCCTAISTRPTACCGSTLTDGSVTTVVDPGDHRGRRRPPGWIGVVPP